MTLSMLVAGAVFAGSCIMVIAALFILLSPTPKQNDDTPVVEAKEAKQVKAIALVFGLLCAVVAYWSGSWLFGSAEEPAVPARTPTEPNQIYPGDWREDAPTNIVLALSANKVRGCGEFHYKASTEHSGEYLVYCTADGENWTAYLVWPDVKRVSGPARPYPSISPPR